MKDAPVQIRNPDVVRDIRALAQRLGLPMTDVIADAVRRRLAEEETQADSARAGRAKRLAEVLASIDALPHTGPPLRDDELFDADGFPR